MASSLIPDPLQLWRDALNRLEGEVNTLATGSLQSQEVLRALHQFSGASLGMQQMFEKAVAGHLRRANLPSREEVAELAESLRRIEDKLDRLLPAQAAPAVPRPPRTRRPSGAAASANMNATTAPEPAPAPAAKVPAARPSAPKTARRRVRGG